MKKRIVFNALVTLLALHAVFVTGTGAMLIEKGRATYAGALASLLGFLFLLTGIALGAAVRTLFTGSVELSLRIAGASGLLLAGTGAFLPALVSFALTAGIGVVCSTESSW